MMNVFSKKSSHFLGKVLNELDNLRDEVAKLVDKGGHAIEDADLSEKAHEQWQHGRDYVVDRAGEFARTARDRAGDVARSAREHPTGLSIGSLLVLGLVGYGIYSVMSSTRPDYDAPDDAPIDPQI